MVLLCIMFCSGVLELSEQFESKLDSRSSDSLSDWPSLFKASSPSFCLSFIISPGVVFSPPNDDVDSFLLAALVELFSSADS